MKALAAAEFGGDASSIRLVLNGRDVAGADDVKLASTDVKNGDMLLVHLPQ